MAQHFEVLVLHAAHLEQLGIPADLSAELVPCVARGLLSRGRPRTMHLTNLAGSLTNPTQASVVFTTNGTFSRLVLQRAHIKVLEGQQSVGRCHSESMRLSTTSGFEV